MAQTLPSIFILLPLFVTYRCVLGGTLPIRALIIPISLDKSTSLYTFTAGDGRSFVIDLSGRTLWQSCRNPHPTIPCGSYQCNALSDPSFKLSCRPPAGFKGCTRGTACTIPLKNTIDQKCTTADLTQTSLTLNSTNGKNPTGPVSITGLTAACAPSSFLATLPSHAQGVAPLGPTAALFASAVPGGGLKKKFAICLSGTANAPGLLLFGDGPVTLLAAPPVEITRGLSYTPLVKQPNHPLDHFIPVKAIAAGGQGLNVAIRGGVAKLSTTIPYTLLSTPIYKAVVGAFETQRSGVPRVKPVKPFELCFDANALGYTRIGPPVPQIDLMMTNGKNWTVFGANSMVEIDQSTTCLAFLDGGYQPEFDVVMGWYQMHDNFLLFDLEKSMLGYTSILYGIRTTCSNFNFTSAA